MAMKVYKPGQGYWTRVLSAVCIGLLVLAAAAWAWEQAGTIRLPAQSHNIAVQGATGEINVGDTVTYLRPAVDFEGGDEPFGTALVESVSISNDRFGTIVAGTFSNDEVRDDFGQATRLVIEGGADAFEAQIQSASANPIFPRNYLQAGAAGLMLLIGFGIIYWFTGVGRKTNEFLIATDGEMKKVNWSTRKEVIGSTWVVIIAAFLIAAILYGVDQVFALIFRAVGVLET
ncbi:MAG: preprotein translocase subunit SecE [Phycisphaerales bacterium]